MAKGNQQFQTIRTEGAILPPDILRRIASLKVEGATPDAYHLPPGSKLNEAISQSWTSLLNHWQSFRKVCETLPESEQTGTAVTNERWLLPLFKELDYGRLVTTKSPEIRERVYPIERFYNHTPIHLIGCKLPLDRRTKGARGAATASPHSMVQEFLNRSEGHLWAFLSNGLQLRILRDNVSLSRQAFVEFDLEAMMEGEVYADFALLWLLCHQSRVESDKAVDCWLEKWSKLARDQGTRVLNDLRVGVKKAIEALGCGFIGHPRNDHFREKLRSGLLSTDEFYRQLLRTVYRLLFLFVAEDRELLHPPDASAEVCDLYDTHYSMRRLRELAHKIRGSKHADLWHSLSLVFDALGKNEGCLQLGLSGFGSFLWQANSTADLLAPHQTNGEAVFITNDDLLQAVRALAYVEQDKVLRIVDYRNLGSEELGSVYESLLELHPVMNAEAKAFELSTAAGNERKTTGSYYTPDSLVQCLLDSALDPVVEERLKKKKGEAAEQAILDMKVCDPACGSGHFLIAAAHRLARHLARFRTGEAEPGPEDYQHALRDIIGRCVYGVDLNPMAVELCKVSLWIEALEPGKPLSFLDHHIQCGNSLLGATPALLAKGIPDEAFKPIEGDVNAVCTELKGDNKRERAEYNSGQGYLFSPTLKLGNLLATIAQINVANDKSVQDVAAKQESFDRMVEGADYLDARLLADIWCAAFVWKKDESELGRLCPTERDFRRIVDNPQSVLPLVKVEVRRLAHQYHFFQWHVAFPDVFCLPENGQKAENEQTGWDGGFDVVLGNPPWDQLLFREQEFFAVSAPEIAQASSSTKRKKLIAALESEQPDLYVTYLIAQRHAEGERHIAHEGGLFPLTGRGRSNTFSLFSELNTEVASSDGRVGCIVPSGIATDDTTKHFFQWLVGSKRLVSLFDFENRGGFFPEVDSRMKFCLLTVQGPTTPNGNPACFIFFAQNTNDLDDGQKVFELSTEDIALLNPNTRTCCTFRSRHDAELCKFIYRRTPILIREGEEQGNLWEAITKPGLFNMAGDSGLFKSTYELENDGYERHAHQFARDDEVFVPLFEGKMFNAFDHRAASVRVSKTAQLRLGQPEEFTLEQHLVPDELNEPRYWVGKREVESRLKGQWERPWIVGWKEVTSSTNERTLIPGVLPRVGIGHKIPIILPSGVHRDMSLCLAINFSAFVLDFVTRQKLGTTSLTPFTVKQLPVLPSNKYRSESLWNRNATVGEWLLLRAMELTYTAWDLEAFAQDCGYDGPPFRWDEERRFLLRCELDAAYFHLYLGSPDDWRTENAQLLEMFATPRDAVDYIMETFPIVKRKDIARTEVKNDSGEVTQEGRYITKENICEIYDEMAESIRTGDPYETRLRPPPGPPTDTEGRFIPMAEWDLNNWPSHIHPPREEAVTT